MLKSTEPAIKVKNFLQGIKFAQSETAFFHMVKQFSDN
jgi:hypothetical protein